jgi:hypothetical protein
MRWERKPREFGDIRIRKGFLFRPMHIANETRWLCFASWQEKYTWHGCYSYPVASWDKLAWND